MAWPNNRKDNCQEERAGGKEQSERDQSREGRRGQGCPRGSPALDSQFCRHQEVNPGWRSRGGGRYIPYGGLENDSSLVFPQQADSEAAGGFSKLGRGGSGTSKDRRNPGHLPQGLALGAALRGWESFAGERGRCAEAPCVISWKLRSSSEGLLFMLTASSNLLSL